VIYKERVDRTAAQDNRGFVLGLGGAAVVVATLWWTPLLFPFRLLSTTIHELSHAITVMLTGGTVQGFSVSWNGSGVVHATGGWPLFVYSAGYLGSTVFGGLMLLIAKNANGRRGALRFVAVTIAAVLAVAGVLRARDNGRFLDVIVFDNVWTLGIVVALVVGLLLVADKAHDVIIAFVCYTIAVLSVTYALFDLINVFTSSVSPLGCFNDARGLATATGIPAPIWAGAWCVVAALIVWKFTRAAWRAR
jgi:hypothetical protein